MQNVNSIKSDKSSSHDIFAQASCFSLHRKCCLSKEDSDFLFASLIVRHIVMMSFFYG